MAIADELIAILGFDLRGTDAAKRYGAILEGLNKKLDDMVVATGKFAGMAAVAVAGGMAVLGRSVIGASAQFESFTETLTTMEGSSQAAQESLAWIAEFGRQTPYDLAGVTDAFIQLKAYGIDPIANDTLRTLGDTASSMGKTLDDAVQMFTDASGMEFERLKEFGIRATQAGDEVTFAWTENGQEMTRTVKKNGDEVRAFILENLGERFQGAMERQSRTYTGMMSNLGDSWDDFQRRVGAAGFFDSVKGRLQNLLDTISRLDADGTLDRWATNVSNVLTTVSETLWFLGNRFTNNAAFIAENWDRLSGPIKAVGVALGFAVARAFPLISAFVLVGLVLDDLITYMQGGQSVIGDFVGWLQSTIGVSEDVAEAIAAMAAAIGLGLTTALLFKPSLAVLGFRWLLVTALPAAIGAAVSAISAAIPAMAAAIQLGLAAMSTAVNAGITAALFLLTNPIGWAILLAGAAAGLIWYFWDDLVAAWNELATRATELFNQMKDWFLSIDWLGVGSQIMTAIWDGMKSIGAAIRDWFLGLFELPEWMGQNAAPGPMTPGQLGYSPSIGTAGTGLPSGVNAPAGITPEQLSNLQTYLGRVAGDNPANAVLNDSRSDNRQFPQTNNVTVNQTVTQATDAPGAAAAATGRAVSGAAAQQRSQIETEPSF